jgi:AraC-like DNA-binding protein
MGEKPNGLLSIAKTAQMLDISERTVKRLIYDDRKLEYCKIRGGVRIFVDSVQKYIAAQVEITRFDNGCAEFSCENWTNSDK